MTENSDVKKRFQSIPIFGEFRFFRQNDHELESGLGGRQLASHDQTGAPSIRHAARITVHIQHPTARRPGRQHNGYALFHGIFNAGNHRQRHVAATETFDHDAFAPLSKTYRTCHKPEVGLILLSNRFENLPKSSGHGNGIAAFLARCFLLSRITRQVIVAFCSSSWGTYRLKRCRCSPPPNASRFRHAAVNAPVV